MIASKVKKLCKDIFYQSTIQGLNKIKSLNYVKGGNEFGADNKPCLLGSYRIWWQGDQDYHPGYQSVTHAEYLIS